MTARRITVLGSTGSVGLSTLDVLRRQQSISVYALGAGSNWRLMLEQCREFRPEIVVMEDLMAAEQLAAALKHEKLDVQVGTGQTALCEIASASEVSIVMAAIVGAAGLPSALAAVMSGKTVLLANKESLVMAGRLFTQAAKDSGATVLPIDSEHNAIFQCLPLRGQQSNDQIAPSGVRKVVLTASGGPFLHASPDQLLSVTPEQACRHPNWSMGQKISVDSASMMNKGLEFIEACYLFDLNPDQVKVLIHPQSIVHSMVEYIDGSVLAQLGSPDMRVPIAHALAWPERIESGASFLDLAASPDLQFMEPDMERFPCLELAIAAARAGGHAPVVLNAANEIAVAGFLERKLGFLQIPQIVEKCLEQISCPEPVSMDMILEVDRQARAMAEDMILGFRPGSWC
ncbi:1-deoxy-D-xylulose-5-phosphate reductoisomerase [Pseudohongiella spirulinae]|uniref:1-deoxy-D-xylulose-5-phosphate reductoisomerase n=1 Tax=Pseudohongiella spirulinae TaxID=1249552 RepID=UPI002FF82182